MVGSRRVKGARLARVVADRATARKRQQRRPHPSSASDSTNRTKVRLPRNGVLLVDPLQVPVDGGFRMPRRIGHVAHAIAFRQPDRHLSFCRRQFQGRGHQVGIDAMLAPPARQSAPARQPAALRGPVEGPPTGLTCTTNGGATDERREHHRPTDSHRARGRQRVAHQPIETDLVGRPAGRAASRPGPTTHRRAAECSGRGRSPP